MAGDFARRVFGRPRGVSLLLTSGVFYDAYSHRRSTYVQHAAGTRSFIRIIEFSVAQPGVVNRADRTEVEAYTRNGIVVVIVVVAL